MKRYKSIPGDYYKKVMESGHPTQRFLYDIREHFVFELVDAKKGEKILDLGFGSGILLKMLMDAGCKAYGTDISADAVAFFKKYNKKAKVKVDDAQSPDFPDNTFDKVVCSEVIEHVKKPEKLLKGVYRILKPKGKFIISTPNYTSHWPLIEWMFDRSSIPKKRYQLREQHISKFNFFSLRRAMEKAGFKIEKYGSLFILSLPVAYISTSLAYKISALEKKMFGSPFGMVIFARGVKR